MSSWTSASSGQRGRREEWPGESETGRIRAPLGNLEVHRNPHEPAQTRGRTQKKTNPMRGWSSCLVGPQGLEPWTKGLCLPLRLSPPLASLWSGLYLPVTGWPSSLYTFPRATCGGLARYWRRPQAPASTEFDQFYPPPACCCRRATHETSHSSDDVQAGFATSAALTD